MLNEKKVVDRSDEPVTMHELASSFKALGLEQGDVVLAHVSLSKLGWVCGEAQAVVDVLLSIVGPTGTVVMPAFSSSWSEPAHWRHPAVPEPWHQTIREQMPAFDPLKTPTRGLGRTAELFRTYPDVLRGEHPQLSFAACGAKAHALLSNCALNYPLGDERVLGRLYKEDAKILLVGCGYESCTSLHLAEHRMARDPTRRTMEQGASVLRDGQRCWTTFFVNEAGDDDFEVVGDAFEQNCPDAWSADTVGIGVVRLLSMTTLVDFATPWLTHYRCADVALKS